MHMAAEPSPQRVRAFARKAAGVKLTTVWAIAAVAVPTAIAASIPLSSVDLAYHLRAGRIMLDLGSVLREDVFTSSAAGLPWLNQQWGGQIILAALFDAGGWFALAIFRAVVAALVTALVYASCRNVGASRRWAAGLTLAGGVMLAGGFLVRPQVFGVICFAVTHWLLSRRDRHRMGMLWALPVAVLWANTHGSFFLAPLLFAIAWAQDVDRKSPSAHLSLAVGIATIPLTLVGPFGVRVWSYVVSIATDERIRNVATEWRPPTTETFEGVLFLASVVAVALFVGFHWSEVRWPTLAGLACFLVIGSLSIRGGVWWILAAPVLIAGLRPGPVPAAARADPRGVANAVLVGIFCLLAVVPLVRWAPYRGDAPPVHLVTSAPPGITRTLAGLMEPGEAFFNAQQWGSWFEFALADHPVFVDSRFELIPDRAWVDYDRVSAGREGWQAILDRHGFGVVALARDQQASLLPLIEADPAWTLVYEDAAGAVFARSSRT